MITFREERENGDVIEHKIASDEVTLSEVLEQFEYFLKGCSYVFDGQVDIVNEEEDNQPFYFDPPSDGNMLDLTMADTITLDLTDTYGTTTTTLKDD